MDYKVKITKTKVYERRNFIKSISEKMGHNVAVEVCGIISTDTARYQRRRYFLYDEVCLWEMGDKRLREIARDDFMTIFTWVEPPSSTNNKTIEEYNNQIKELYVTDESGFVTMFSEKITG